MLFVKLLSLGLFLVSLYGAEEPFSIWLSSSVIMENSINQQAEFIEAAGESNTLLREAYIRSFKNSFPKAVEAIDPKQQTRTYAVFLSISRVSKYEVNASDSKIVLYSLPVTAAINFMNVLTGELLYTQAYTYIGNFQTMSDDPQLHEKLVKAYQDTYQKLIEDLAHKASVSFIPKKLQTKAIGKKFGLLILDKGLADGISEGDGLDGPSGSLLKVKYASMKYSVAKEEFGTISIGSEVTKTYNQALADFKKPKVTLLDVEYDHEKLKLPSNMFYQFFVDKLSQQSSFTLVPINKSFWKAINSLQGSANLGIRFSKRSTPEYFMRLWIDGPYTYDLPTNVSYLTNRHYQMTICGEIVDTSARVVASACKNEKIEDNISFGNGYSKEAQYEVIAKNGALSLAEEFAHSVAFEPITYKIDTVHNGLIEISDEKNILNIGSTVTVYRNLGEVGGTTNVYIPISYSTITQKEGNKLYAKEIMKTFNDAPDVSEDDVIFEQIIKSANDTAKVFTLCDLPSKVGTAEIEGFESGAQYIIAQKLKYPFYHSNGLQESINKHIDESEFEFVPQVISPSSGYCINPVYKYNLLSSKESDDYLENKYSAIVGIKEFKNGEMVTKYGLGGEKSLYPPIQDSKVYLHTNLLEQTLGELENAIKKFEIK
jgi:hypothetical protein